MELQSNMSWSPTIPGRFQRRFGYDMRKFLPLLTFSNNNINIQSDLPGPFQSFLDTEDAGLSYRHDYRQVLADGYREYLGALRSWLRERLDIGLSAQVSYNMPMDMLSNIPFVDAPESESLQAVNNIDAYRNFAGPAHLAGLRVVSNELGAVFTRAFQMSVQELLHAANRGFAGGLNQFVIHGQPYSGGYPATTWPGHTPFLYHASDLWSPKRPDWACGLAHGVEYMARIQHVQRQGVALTDVAVYKKDSATDPYLATTYEGLDLTAIGECERSAQRIVAELSRLVIQLSHF